jgi:hypothetical protein
MERVPVSSTTIASIGYDPLTLTLEVEFIGGSIYQYFDVPQSVHDEVMLSPSVGKALNAIVKQNYRFAKQ